MKLWKANAVGSHEHHSFSSGPGNMIGRRLSGAVFNPLDTRSLIHQANGQWGSCVSLGNKVASQTLDLLH